MDFMRLLRRYAPRNDATPDFLRNHQKNPEKSVGKEKRISENKGAMGIFQSTIQYLKEYILFNPVVWGIAAVVIWIVGSAFIKAWRGKNEEDDGKV
jgi:sugar phosphate permease